MAVLESYCQLPSSKGLYQGDPLFPLPFVIVMEAFKWLVDKASLAGLLAGFFAGCQDKGFLVVSHLLFVDDYFLCGRYVSSSPLTVHSCLV